MEDLGGLFDMTPQQAFAVGDLVTARTIWGNEDGEITELKVLDDGMRFAHVKTAKRGEILVGLSRLTRR